jgi:hypothetical protein
MRFRKLPNALLLLLIEFSLNNVRVFAQVQPVMSGTLAGRVVCSDSQAPCRFASVTIQSAPPEQKAGESRSVTTSHSYSAATDITGSFEIREVAPGDYFVLARLEGYLCPYDELKSEMGENAAPPMADLNSSLTRVTVAAGQTVLSTVTLSRGASLGGDCTI